MNSTFDFKTSLELERFLQGELSPAQLEALRAKVGERALQAFAARHAQESAALFAKLSAPAFRARVEALARNEVTTARKPALAMWLAPAVAAAVALFVWVAVPN